MDWEFIGVLFGTLVVAGLFIHIFALGASIPVHPSPAAPIIARKANDVEATHIPPSVHDLESVRVYKPENWCFVHEDHLGRWCVKTASPASCDPMRRFQSRDACELVSASALPLGVVNRRGATKQSFMAMMSNGLS